jgi:two-component system sensor histidine kinase DegS
MSVTSLQVAGGPGSRASLAAALRSAGHVPFEFDPRSGRLVWLLSDGCGVLGHDVDAVASLPAWMELIHPEERALLGAGLCGDGSFGAQSQSDLELPASRLRMRNAAGEYRWLELRSARHDEAGRTLQVGTLVDITPRREAEQRLALCALILETLHEAVTVTDRDGRILWANAAFGSLVGVSRDRLAGLDLQQFAAVSGARLVEQRQAMRDAIARRGAWQGRVDARREDGSVLITEACVSAVDGDQGDLWVHVHRDVTERVALEEAALDVSRSEQQRLGLELHDRLDREIAGTSMLVRTLCTAVSAGACADPALLRDVEPLLQGSVSRCRDLAQGVSPFIIDENGLGAAVQDLVHRARAATGMATIRADVCVRAAGFGGNFGYHLYRLVQLSFASVLARPGEGSVDLQLGHEDDDRVALAIVADGVVARHAPESPDERLLRHRLALLDGSLEPLQAGRGRSGLIAMVPVAVAAPPPAAQSFAVPKAIRA